MTLFKKIFGFLSPKDNDNIDGLCQVEEFIPFSLSHEVFETAFPDELANSEILHNDIINQRMTYDRQKLSSIPSSKYALDLSVPAYQAKSSMLDIIKAEKDMDPLINVKIAGNEIYRELLKYLKDSKREVQAQGLLCAIGSLAGYACQDALTEHAQANDLSLDDVFIIIEDHNKHKFYFGESIDALLATDEHSLWNVALEALQKTEVTSVLDIKDLFSQVTRTAATSALGTLNVSDRDQPLHSPQHYLINLWERLQIIPEIYCEEPLEYPIAYAFAAQKAIQETKQYVNHDVVLKILMESAIAMSTIEFAKALNYHSDQFNQNHSALTHEKPILLDENGELELSSDTYTNNHLSDNLSVPSIPDPDKKGITPPSNGIPSINFHR